uniref:Uncharacterized protein n=1 Tax=Oryza sativa subsp. japonica TaxID=39947 RepID=Q6H6S0_ORYSJ|nr:hypothetical protein [Oryza sativa Japonica Group]
MRANSVSNRLRALTTAAGGREVAASLRLSAAADAGEAQGGTVGGSEGLRSARRHVGLPGENLLSVLFENLTDNGSGVFIASLPGDIV